MYISQLKLQYWNTPNHHQIFINDPIKIIALRYKQINPDYHVQSTRILNRTRLFPDSQPCSANERREKGHDEVNESTWKTRRACNSGDHPLSANTPALVSTCAHGTRRSEISFVVDPCSWCQLGRPRGWQTVLTDGQDSSRVRRATGSKIIGFVRYDMIYSDLMFIAVTWSWKRASSC